MTDQDAVDRAFRALQDRVDRAAVAPPTERIEARGRRRRTGHVALAGLTALAVITGGWAVSRDPGRDAVPNPPAATATTGKPPSASPEKPPTGTRPVKIPPGFLAGESSADEVIDDHDYQAGCLGQPVARRVMSEFDGEQAQRRQLTQALYVYRDEDAAKAVMRDLKPKLQQCSGFEGASVLKPVSTPALGGEALSITIALPRDGAGEHAGEPFRFLVVRVGSAVAVFDGIPRTPETIDRSTALIPRLCVFGSGCPPQGAVPVTPAVNGGEAWAAVVGVHETGTHEPPADEKAGELATRGYRAAVVPLACDVGAAAALGVPEGRSYSVVYFGSRQDAETLGLPVVRVRTYCL
ncbi:hypothetical protein ACFO1B_05095 [Dactylosporangium siamense]|uniref:Uncharacterized protein n=1 Tax=Dactylosporangium siamense TaxID=685454 RepID=A0A919PDE9_9ACTN|nr:hypothetical protein [Dactylosporangium siamense]GIG42736.1 hypothetical protein Dsi01nite_007770 [Dactylosporangium siamense]